jgi:hypothetical protein
VLVNLQQCSIVTFSEITTRISTCFWHLSVWDGAFRAAGTLSLILPFWGRLFRNKKSSGKIYNLVEFGYYLLNASTYADYYVTRLVGAWRDMICVLA